MAPARTKAQPTKWWSSKWFKLALSIVLLSVLLWKTDLSDLRDAVTSAQPGWVAIALMGYILSMVISSIRWTSLARPLGFDEPYSHFFYAYFTGMYMNLFAPSTVAGDIGRALYLAGAQRRKALAFTTVIADRGLGFVVLSWIGALAIVLQPQYQLPLALYYAAWTIPPGTLLSWLYLPQLVVRLFKRDNHWRHLVEKDLAPYWNDFGLLFRTSLVAVVFHGLQIGSQVWLARALGIDVPWPFFFIFVPVVNILGMLPVSFSGIGIREFGYLYFLKMVGIEHHTAVALGLLASGVVLCTGLTGGLVFLLWKAPPSASSTAVEGSTRRRAAGDR